MLSRTEEELSSTSALAKTNDIKLQEIKENAAKSMDNLIKQLDGTSSETLLMCELQGLDKQLKSIRGSFKVEVAKKAELQQCIENEKCKLKEIRDNPEHDDGIREDNRKQIKRYNNELKSRQESIDLLKGRFTKQITSFKEMIAKVLDKDVSFAEKIWTLYREQGIMIASILTAIRMAISILVEALLPSGSRTGSAPAARDKPLPTNEKGEWIRNKLNTLARQLGRFGAKVAKVLPGIIGVILSWILNRAADVVHWVSQNLWTLAVGIRGLLYMYMLPRSKNYITICPNVIQSKYHKTPLIPIMLKAMNANSLSCCSLLGV